MRALPGAVLAGRARVCGAFALSAACVLGGCSPGTETLTLEVRDRATREPARNVRVFADVPSRDHAFSLATIFGTTGPISSQATTDEQGRASLKYISGRPVRVGVLNVGWCPGPVMLEPASATFAAEVWLTAPESGTKFERFAEYRVLREP